MIYTDINECGGVNDCEQLCTNTKGSYTCNCTEGFDLADDGRRCTGIRAYVTFSTILTYPSPIAKDFCVDGGECSDICAVVNFEEKCFCPVGFTLTTLTECTGIYFTEFRLHVCMHPIFLSTDVDECLNTPCGQLCTNTDGSFECSCMSGYKLQEDRRTCEGNNTLSHKPTLNPNSLGQLIQISENFRMHTFSNSIEDV